MLGGNTSITEAVGIVLPHDLPYNDLIDFPRLLGDPDRRTGHEIASRDTPSPIPQLLVAVFVVCHVEYYAPGYDKPN